MANVQNGAPDVKSFFEQVLDALTSGPYLSNYPKHRSALPLCIQSLSALAVTCRPEKPRHVEDL